MGSDNDFDEMFARLYPQARSVAKRLVRDHGAAEELAAEAFTRAYARWPLLRHRPHREAWIIRVTSNLAIDHVRRRVGSPELRDPAIDPLSVTDDRLLLAFAIRDLPRRQREVIVLRYLADLSERDVAATLNIAEGTVKAHTARGLSGLRGLLGTHATEVLLHG